MKKKFLVYLILMTAGCRSGGGDRPLTFGLVADIQFAVIPALGTRDYSYSWLKLIQNIEEFNRRNVSFVIQLGDLIDHDAASYDLILPIFKKSKAPVYHVIGNHDFDIDPILKPLVMKKLGSKNGSYTFSLEKWRFIVLNGDELSFNYPADDRLKKEAEDMFNKLTEKKRANATKWNGGISRVQFEWLKTELDRAEQSRRKVIVFSHFPVLPPADLNLWNDEEVVSLLKKYPCVKACFSGHNHEGDYAFESGIHYVTFKGLVETRGSNAAAVITLTQDKIEIEGLGRELSRSLVIR